MTAPPAGNQFRNLINDQPADMTGICSEPERSRSVVKHHITDCAAGGLNGFRGDKFLRTCVKSD